MLVGPIFALETVTSVRRPRYFLVRVLYAAGLLVALCIVYSIWTESGRALTVHDFAEFGATFFQSFAALQLLLVVCVGPGLVGGTIAQERERRTIEYLFATDLSNSEIVLGKLSARLMLLLYLVLVGLPVLAITMLMGGISPARLILVFLMTASSMVMVTGISMAISVWTPRAREAVTRSYVILLALFGLPPVITMARSMVPMWLDVVLSPLVSAGLRVNPFWRLATLGIADPVGLSGVWSAISTLVLMQLAIGALCLAAAVWGVRRVHLKSAGVSKKTSRLSWPQFSRPKIDRFPMLWKELFAEQVVPKIGIFGRLVVLFIACGILVPTAMNFYTMTANSLVTEFLFFAVAMGTVVGCGGLLLIAARAASSVTSEKERDTWTTLLSTPLEPAEIVLAKVLGNLYAARLVFVLLAVIWGLAIVRDPDFLWGAIGSGLVLLLGALCVSLMGVIFSLWCSTSQRAMAGTITVLAFMGGGYLVCCLPFMISNRAFEEIVLAFCVPFLIAMPAVAAVEPIPPGEGAMIAAFVIGILGYSVLTVVLWMLAVASFDQLAGRTSGIDTFFRRSTP